MAISNGPQTLLESKVWEATFDRCIAHSRSKQWSEEQIHEHVVACDWCRNQVVQFRIRFGARTEPLESADLQGLPKILRDLFAPACNF